MSDRNMLSLCAYLYKEYKAVDVDIDLKSILSSYEVYCKSIIESTGVTFYDDNVHDYLVWNYEVIEKCIIGMDIEGLEDFSRKYYNYILAQCESDISHIKIWFIHEKLKPRLYVLLNEIRNIVKSNCANGAESEVEVKESEDVIECESFCYFLLRFYNEHALIHSRCTDDVVSHYSRHMMDAFLENGAVATDIIMTFNDYIINHGGDLTSLVESGSVRTLEVFSRGYIQYLERAFERYNANVTYIDSLGVDDSEVVEILERLCKMTNLNKGIRQQDEVSTERNTGEDITVEESSGGIVININSPTFKIECDSELLKSIISELKCIISK